MYFHLERIRRINPLVNAVKEVFAEEARAADKESDRRRACGEGSGRLADVPFTVKTNLDVAGYATTHGVPALSGAVAALDSRLVKRLRASGAIPLAHTNLPDLSLRLHTRSNLYGATRNPWEPSLTPGGSSGGEGGTLATVLSPLGLGNECGQLGAHPGRLQRRGGAEAENGTASSPAPSPTSTWPFGCWSVPIPGIRGPCPPRSKGRLRRGRSASRSSPIREGMGVHPEARRAVEQAAEALRMDGYETEAIDLPEVAQVVEACGRLVMAEFRLSRPMLERLLGRGQAPVHRAGDGGEPAP